jgi:outer membrane protein TolC
MSAACLCRAEEPASSTPVLTLNEAIQTAIAQNRSLQIASLDVEKSKWTVASAKTHRLPIFNTSMFASGNITDPVFTFKQGIFGTIDNKPIPTQNTEIPLSQGVTGYAIVQVAQPITQLYKINLGVKDKELSSDLASQQYRGKRQSVVSDVKQAYYAILQSQSALEAAQTSVKQYQETDRLMLEYVSQEVVLKSDSLDVKAQLAQSQYQVVSLHNSLQNQKEQLNDLMGRELETEFQVEQVPAMTLQESDLKIAQQTALEQRPEIKEAEINVQRADIDRRMAKAQYIPDVGIALHYFTPLNTEILPTNILSGGVELSWEPFDWGRRRDEVNQKKVTLSQSEYQLQEARSKVLLDVNRNFRKLDQSRAALTAAQAAQVAANEKLREVSDKFRQNTVLLRDLLQQQTSTANANKDYEDALLSFWSAKAEFEKALGEE